MACLFQMPCYGTKQETRHGADKAHLHTHHQLGAATSSHISFGHDRIVRWSCRLNKQSYIWRFSMKSIYLYRQ